MASKTQKTEMKRLRRDNGMGRKRKNAQENKGTTLSAAALFGDVKTPAKKK